MQFDLFTYLLAQQNGGGGTGGSGINYKSMTINSDNSVTVIDNDNNEHTLVPTYTDNVITAITYDDKDIALVYDDNGNLTKIGDSDVDLENYPYESGSNIGYQVKFVVEGNDYYVAQCLQGDTITEPPTPTIQSGHLRSWQLNGVDVTFPYTPSADVELTADISNINYIQSTGTQYLNTGIAPTNHRIVAKFQYVTLPSDACVFGGKTSETSLCMDLAWYQNKWYYVDGSTQGNFSLATIATDEVIVDFNNYDNQITINGAVGATINGTNNNNYPLYIFRRNASPYAYSTMKLFYFQMYDRETETLVLDLIPAFDTNNAPCMYDRVSGMFFTNAGTGTFLYG